jgi:lipopolysaccharide export system protein LptC
MIAAMTLADFKAKDKDRPDRLAILTEFGRRRPARSLRYSLRQHYSLFVTVMKVILPALAAGLLLLLMVWPQLDPSDNPLGLGLSDLSIERPNNLSVLNARFSGYDDQSQPFAISADMATQAPEDENLIALELPKADITLADGAWLGLTAREGLYNRNADTLDLSGQVSFFHDRGFELHTETAQIDLQAGSARGEDAVTGHGYFGEIEAEGFQLFDRGERIVFTGQSRVLVHPGAKGSLAAGSNP